ncbi:MAG: hypothetical protein NTZ38_01855 [Candidatus Taylorbacteria bacterium]|nr:hypothetical protein [Candidatus Taylorbacteria bacterium]
MEGLNESQLRTAILEIQRADQILLDGIDSEMGEFQGIKEHLVEISELLFSTLFGKAKDETFAPKDRLECVENMNKLDIILGREIYDDLLLKNLTNRETLEELKRKLNNGGRWWKKILN